MPDPAQRRKKFLIRLGIGSVLVVIALIIAGFYLEREVRRKLLTELNELGIGQASIESIDISFGGVTARQIEFKKEPGNDAWLTVESLAINHSLWGLVTGAEIFDEIEVSHVAATIDAEELSDASTPEFEFDLSTFSLPAHEVNVDDVKVLVRQKGRDDFAAICQRATASQTDQQIKFNCEVDEFLAGKWTANGTIARGKNQFEMTAECGGFKVKNEQWKRWPFVPDTIIERIDADLASSFKAQLNGDDQQAISYQLELDLGESALTIPGQEISLAVSKGKIEIVDGLATLSEMTASLDEQGEITLNANSQLTNFPINVQFKGDLKDANVERIAQRIPGIPKPVKGNVTGGFDGNLALDVEQGNATISLNANATSTNGTYANVPAKIANGKLDLRSLVLDSQGQIQSIDGVVILNARVEHQSAENLLASIDLQSLTERLQISSQCDGNIGLQIPLSSASDLRSWIINFDALGETGSLVGQPVKNIDLAGRVDNGNLKITKLAAIPVDNNRTIPTSFGPADLPAQSSLNATVDWPIFPTATESTDARLNLSASNLPVNWLSGASRNLLGDQAFNDIDLQGQVNFTADVTIPTQTASTISTWTMDGTVNNSSLKTLEHELSNLSFEIGAADQILKLQNLNGDFPLGGKLSGNAEIALDVPDIKNCQLNATQVPASWLVQSAGSFLPGIAENLKQIEIDPSSDIDGLLNVDVTLQPSDQAADSNWIVSAIAKSDQIILKGKTLSNLHVESDVSQQSVDITKAETTIGENGFLKLDGRFDLKNSSASGNVAWRSIPLDWIQRWAKQEQYATGNSSGKFEFKSIAGDRLKNSSIPIEGSGTISISRLAFNNLKFRPFQFALSTDGQFVNVKQFQGPDGQLPLDLSGKIALDNTKRFELTGQINQLNLANWLAQPSVLERTGELTQFDGNASATFSINGTLQPLNWKTNGDAVLLKTTFDGNAIGDFAATWNFDSETGIGTKLQLHGFGGTFVLDHFDAENEIAKLTATGIDLARISDILSTTHKNSGIATASLELSDWSDQQRLSLMATVNTDLATVESIKLENVESSVALANRQLEIKLNAVTLGGSIVGSGASEINFANLSESEIPFALKFENLALEQLSKSSQRFASVAPASGTVSGNSTLLFAPGKAITGDGNVIVGDLRWKQKAISRQLAATLKINDNELSMENIRGDVYRGSIVGNAVYNLNQPNASRYDIQLRSIDAHRFASFVADEKVDLSASVDARLAGRFGSKISGQGILSLSRIKVRGISGQSVKLPITYYIDPVRGNGLVELKRSKIKIFDGTANGTAKVEFGSQLNVEADLKLAKINTEKLFTAFSDGAVSDQGKLQGHLKIKGRHVRSGRDLTGSFTGNLERSKALQLPVLSSLTGFLAGNQLNNREFTSDEFELNLNKGRVEIRNLNFSNSVAKIAIGGDAYLDGRLDLTVAARTERFDQPTLIQEIAGSPLLRFTGTPAGFIAKASEFLSNRLVFLQVKGNVKRPQVRPDTTRQLGEETIQYFLRGTDFSDIFNRRTN